MPTPIQHAVWQFEMQIDIPADLAQRLTTAALLNGVSESEIVQMSLDALDAQLTFEREVLACLTAANAGRRQSFSDFDADFRNRHGFPAE